MNKILLLFLLSISLTVTSQNIELDTTYGTNGSTINDKGYTDGIVYSSLLSDGSLLMSLHIENNSSEFGRETIVVKYTPTGIIDTSFANNGIFSLGPIGAYFTEIYTDNNDNIYIINSDGEYNEQENIIKLSSSGIPITAFGDNGTLDIEKSYQTRSSFMKNNYIYLGIVYDDQKIVRDTHEGILRIDLNGNIDTTFGEQGYLDIEEIYHNELFVTSDDGLVISTIQYEREEEVFNEETLTYERETKPSSFTIVKYKPEGGLDETYGNNGYLISTIGDNNERVSFLEDDNNLYIAVFYYTSSNYSKIYKYDLTGTLITEFGDNGSITINDFYATSLKKHQDNLFILGVNFTNLNKQINSYKPDTGLFNTSFSEQGVFDESSIDNDYPTEFYFKDDSIIVTGINDNSNDERSYYSSKYIPKQPTLSVNQFNKTLIDVINPIEDLIEINAKSVIETLELYTLNGQLLKRSNTNTIAVQDLSSNMYFLKCYLENGAVFSKKIIKK